MRANKRLERDAAYGRAAQARRWAEDLNEESHDRPRRHADACWPRTGALPSIDPRPDYRLQCLRHSAVFGTRKGLAGSTAIVRAIIS
jgi:hypothetical protein